MKKILAILSILVLTAVFTFGLVACQPTEENPTEPTPIDPVQISYQTDASAIIPLFVQGKAEIAVIGEPAVTNLTNKMAKNNVTIYNCFDLQQLWKSATNSTNVGYPQASLIVKKSLLQNKAFVDALLSALDQNASYISANLSTLAQTMKDNGSTLTVNYTQELINRCNLSATRANASGVKTDIETYLTEFGFSASSEKAPLPADDFYFDSTSATSTEDAPASVSLYCPDGAPMLSVAKIIAEKSIGTTTVNVNISTGEDVVAKAMKGEADIVVLPTNAAAKVYNAKKAYSLVTVNVYGVLYVVSTTKLNDLSELSGKLVYSIGQGNTPEYVFKKILTNAGLTYADAE